MPEKREMPISRTQEENAEKTPAVLNDETKQESKEHYTEEEKDAFYQVVFEDGKAIANVPAELHVDIAHRLIKEGRGSWVTMYLEKFIGLDHQDIVRRLVKNGGSVGVVFNLRKFTGIDHKELADALIDEGVGWLLAEHFSSFVGLDHLDIARRILLNDKHRQVNSLKCFNGLNQEIVDILVAQKRGWIAAHSLDKFTGVDQQALAENVIENGDAHSIVYALDKFTDVDQQHIVNLLFDRGDEDYVIDNIGKFTRLKYNSEFASRLMSRGRGEVIYRNLAKFSGLPSGIAWELLKNGHWQAVAEHLDAFVDLDKDIARLLIGPNWGRKLVIEHLDAFANFNHQDLVNDLIEKEDGMSVIGNLDKFTGLNHQETALRLIEKGFTDPLAQNLDKFAGLNHQEIADCLIERGEGGTVAYNLGKFKNIDHVALAHRLIEEGAGDDVAVNIEKFHGLNHQDIANRLIEEETTNAMTNHIEKFEGLTVAGFQKIPRIDSFLTKFESIIPDSSGKFTIEQVLGVASQSENEQNKTLQILKTTPFLAEAFFANRYGIKLILKYPELDEESRENISLLYDAKKNRGNIEQDTPEFRGLVQERLAAYKNNGEIVGALKEKGVDTKEWLEYQEQLIFDLGKEDDTSFAERIHLPITRLGESQEKYIKSFRETLKPYSAQLAQLSIAEENDKLKEELGKMKDEQEKAKTDGNEKKAAGIQRGIDSLQAKIDNPKQVPAWDRIMGDVAMVERFMTDVIRSADAITAQEKNIGELKESSSVENRKKLIEAKTQNLALEKRFRENLLLLDMRIADFEKNTDELLGKLIEEEEKEKIFTAFHELALEDRDHMHADISTLQKLLENDEDEGKGKISLEGIPMSIGVWNRNPDEDLYLGNYTDCCIRIDSEHMGEESTIADYLTDLGMQVITARDEKKDVPVVAAWSFIGKNKKTGEIAFVIDNIEANTDYSIPFEGQLNEKLKTYFEKYAKSIGISKIVQGTKNNDLIIFKMDGDYLKLGGYNRKDGYFLEGEPEEDDGEDDEEENDEWEENQDEHLEISENEDLRERENDDYSDVEERLSGRR